MLVTSLTPDRFVSIGGPASVVILSIRGRVVRLGITADPSIPIAIFKAPDSSAPPTDSPIDAASAVDASQPLSEGTAK